jgi:transposase
LVNCRRNSNREGAHTDGYAGFNTPFALDPNTGVARLTEVVCWVHARRKLYDVYEATASPLATDALERIAELLAIETRINGRSLELEAGRLTILTR